MAFAIVAMFSAFFLGLVGFLGRKEVAYICGGVAREYIFLN